eukprot:310278_1
MQYQKNIAHSNTANPSGHYNQHRNNQRPQHFDMNTSLPPHKLHITQHINPHMPQKPIPTPAIDHETNINNENTLENTLANTNIYTAAKNNDISTIPLNINTNISNISPPITSTNNIQRHSI